MKRGSDKAQGHRVREGRATLVAPLHDAAGARRGTWSIAVSGNWRITFGEEDGCIEHLNLEDYH